MMQGDACLLGIRILNNAGAAVTPADVAEVEITIGQMKKKYSDAALSFRDGVWLFPLSQRETFGHFGPQKAQVRLKWANGIVEGASLGGVRLEESISREVL